MTVIERGRCTTIASQNISMTTTEWLRPTIMTALTMEIIYLGEAMQNFDVGGTTVTGDGGAILAHDAATNT